jgi:hypothetical protein
MFPALAFPTQIASSTTDLERQVCKKRYISDKTENTN